MRLVDRIKDLYKSSTLETRFGMIISIISGVVGILMTLILAILGFGPVVIGASAATGVVAIFMFSRIMMGKSIEIVGFVFGLILTLLLTPTLYYKLGGIDGPTPLLALLGLIIFVVIIRKRLFAVITGLNLVVWVAMVYTQIKSPELVSYYFSQSYHYIVFLVAFVCAYLAISLIVSVVMRDYHKKLRSLEQNQDRLSAMSTTDEMTGLYNRRHIMYVIEQHLQTGNDTVFSVIMADIDSFKTINDNYGDEVSNTVIKRVANIMKANVRSTDGIGRITDAEFLIVLNGADLKRASSIAEKLRIQVKNLGWQEFKGSVTLSLGVYQVQDYDTLNELLDQVEMGLFEAKDSGRNKMVAIAPEE